MARYTFGCLECQAEVDVVGRMAEGPPSVVVCEGCGAQMVRVYQAAQVEMGGNAGELLTGWMEENYWRARKGMERYSLKAVNRVPGESPRPGNDWHRGARERAVREGRAERRTQNVELAAKAEEEGVV